MFAINTIRAEVKEQDARPGEARGFPSPPCRAQSSPSPQHITKRNGFPIGETIIKVDRQALQKDFYSLIDEVIQNELSRRQVNGRHQNFCSCN